MPPRRSRNLRPVPDQPQRAVLYVRVSALMGRSGDAFHSPGMQVEAMRRAIAQAGLREVAVIEDIDRSGQTFNREGIDTIRQMVEAGQVDVVSVYDLSRLGRNLAEALTFVRWLRDRGVSVMSTQERIGDSPEGQFMLSQFLSLAELYGAQIGRRWAEIHARRAKAGKHHGIVPAGYRRVNGRLEVDPVLGPAVTRVFAQYAAGVYVSDIQRDFAAARGKPVRRNVIKWMLGARVYLGRVVIRSQVAGDLDLPGDHDPLVDEDTWERVQRRLAKERTTPPRRLEPKYSLTGLVWCAHCDGAMQVWYSTSGGRRDRRMVCSRQRQIGDCQGPGTPAYDQIEAAVLAEVQAWAAKLRGSPAARAQQINRAAKAGADAGQVERELTRTREAMGRITERWGRGEMNDTAYDKAMASLEQSEDRLSAELDRLRDTADAPDPVVVVRLVDDMRSVWPEATEAERNFLLRQVMVKVRVRRADRWREPVADRLLGWEMR